MQCLGDIASGNRTPERDPHVLMRERGVPGAKRAGELRRKGDTRCSLLQTLPRDTLYAYMEALSAFFSSLFYSLEHLGAFAYLVIFLIALADSLIIVGTFTAGAAFLIFAGILTARGVYGLPEMIVFTAVGAMLGSAISFYLGRAEANFARRKRWFPKEKNLERGARMLAKRGGVSILIARFLGPVSSVMAFVAGTVRMPQPRFHFWNTIAGIAWSASFIGAGYILGSSLYRMSAF